MHSKARRGFEPRSTDSESVVLTATPTSHDADDVFLPPLPTEILKLVTSLSLE